VCAILSRALPPRYPQIAQAGPRPGGNPPRGGADEAGRAGHTVQRIAVAYEAAGDGFWLARWLRAHGIEAYAIHPSSVPVCASTSAPRPIVSTPSF
ncbi:hypothetical protein NKJ32_33685, partial [Mesorhizobium sp. M0159]